MSYDITVYSMIIFIIFVMYTAIRNQLEIEKQIKNIQGNQKDINKEIDKIETRI